MFIAAIIIGIILIFLVFLTFYISNRNDSDLNGDFGGGIFLGMVIAMFMSIEILLIVGITSDSQPTAMDVYQNKTTLEYKVVDDVKVDSVVVFKNDDYGKD